MTKHYALIGERLSYSRSPEIHEAIMKYLDIKGTYELKEISREASNDLQTLNQVLSDYDGFNVTIPYKTTLIPLMDEIDPLALRIGAINTVHRDRGKLRGYNTDYEGLKHALKQLGIMDNQTVSRGVILGTGGSAKMAEVLLEDLNFKEIIIVSRTPKNYHGTHKVLDYKAFFEGDFTAALLLNCTPLGHQADPLITSFKPEVFERFDLFMDLNYNPAVTPLMQLAAKSNQHMMNGFRMLVAQAVYAERIWQSERFEAMTEDDLKQLIEAVITALIA